MKQDLPHATSHGGMLGWYARVPLYARILLALALGIVTGWLLGDRAEALMPFYQVVLRLLGALATPLVFIAVVHALVNAQVSGRLAARMTWLLMVNTVVAILVGLLVANLLQPGRQAGLTPEGERPLQKSYDVVDDLLGKLPGSVLKPLAENDILGVIFLALAAGLGLRLVRGRMRQRGQTSYQAVEDLLETGVQLVMVVLHWVIALVPLAVWGVVARLVGTQGLEAVRPMAWF